MSQNPNNRNSLLLCFQEIIKMMPQAGDLNAFLSALENVEDPLELCLKLANKLRLAPESRGDVTIEELASFFGAPIFLQLNNGNWVLYLGIRKLLQGGVQQERYAVFDPLTKVQGKMLFLQKDQLLKSWAGKAVFIRMEMRGCSVDGKQTSLYCLASIVKHYGDDTDVGRLMHEYAISEDEPSIRLLGKIADDLEYKTKEIHVKWDKLPKIGAAFPCIAIKKDGRFVVLCGVREVPESVAYPKNDETDQPKLTTEALLKQSAEVVPGADPEPEETKQEQAPADDKPKLVLQAAVWDPYVADGHRPSVEFLNKEAWDEKFTSRIVLVKKHYSIVDENQKFGLRWFIPEFFRQRTLPAQVAIAILAISAIGLVVPLFFQIVVDKVLVNEGRVTLMTIGIGVTIMLCVNAILEYLEKYFLLYATNRIDIRLAVKTFARLLSLPVDFYERISSGVLIKHMQQTERIRSFLSGSLFYTALELLSLLVFLPFLFIYSPVLTGVVLLFTFMMALVIALLIKPFQHRLEELYMAEGKRQAMLVETIHGIRTVKSLALEPTQQRKWNDTAAFAITRYFRVAQISITAKTLSGLIEKLMFIAIIWIGALAVFDGTLTVGKLIAFQMLSGRVTGPLVHIVGLVHEYQQTLLSVRMLGVVMNCPQEQVGGSLHHQLQGELSIENVNFRYSPDTPMVIKDFNLHISPGSTIGLVGRSGSGKTTLTKLIQGLYPLQTGIIKYDGIDIREIDRASLRSAIGIVLQDNYFFHGTVRENLSLTKKDATMEEIIYAARLAGADEFIQKMSRGYDSLLEENASNLSGGQRQRLAIARALLPNPRFLIFDEATSALDPESETMVRKNLNMIARNRTVFIISHRLSVLCRADRIVVMDHGDLIEQGTHKELLEQGGIYADFWKQQMGFNEDEQ
ncbi:MAG: peptidase domain-containing ABC transporter [Lentisphaeria bacterium]|nr:peptidase domain-containing ABC transporter [Lentisphaeria bacterium]